MSWTSTGIHPKGFLGHRHTSLSKAKISEAMGGHPPVTSSCNVCGNPFTAPFSAKRKFCSLKCAYSKSGRAINITNRKQPLPDRECVVCGKTFTPNKKTRERGKNQKCCSQSCNGAFHANKYLIPAFEAGKSGKKLAICGWAEIGNNTIFYRSSWELRYAQYLQRLKEYGVIIDWFYEDTIFDLGDSRYYPDFRIINYHGVEEFHEVKGWMRDDSAIKLMSFWMIFPEVDLHLVDSIPEPPVNRE